MPGLRPRRLGVAAYMFTAIHAKTARTFTRTREENDIRARFRLELSVDRCSRHGGRGKGNTLRRQPTVPFTAQSEAPPLREDSSGAVRIGQSRVLLELVIRAFQDGATPET